MTVSPASNRLPRSSTTLSVTPAGTMIQAARGGASFSMNSSIERAPVAPSASSRSTGSGERLVTTMSWPAAMRRRTMFAPMRPRPIMPSCIGQTPFAVGLGGFLRERLEVLVRVAQPRGVHGTAAADQVAGAPDLPAPVEPGHRLDDAVLHVEGDEVAIVQAPPHLDPVPRQRVPHHLEVVVVLIRPEPVDVADWVGGAEHAPCH